MLSVNWLLPNKLHCWAAVMIKNERNKFVCLFEFTILLFPKFYICMIIWKNFSRIFILNSYPLCAMQCEKRWSFNCRGNFHKWILLCSASEDVFICFVFHPLKWRREKRKVRQGVCLQRSPFLSLFLFLAFVC